MACRRSSMFALGALLFLATSAMAAEPMYPKGVTVARELSSRAGDKIRVTFAPPADQSVDPRLFDLVQIEAASPSSGAGPAGRKSMEDEIRMTATAKAGSADEPDIDLSGYSITVEALALSSCRIDIVIAKSKPTTMNRNGQLILNAPGAAGMLVSAFPTSGDVDVLVATELGVCLTSEKPKGTLDVVRCQETSCPNPGRQAYAGAIFNAENSTAKYVGHFAVWFVN